MKKIRILSLLLVLIMVVSLFAGCKSSVAIKDVENNPSEFIKEGVKKSFAASPFGEIIALENTNATSAQIEIIPIKDEMGNVKLDLVFAHDDLALLANLDSNIEGEKIIGSFYADSKQLALKADLLKTLFGTKSIGLNLKDFGKEFKESAWYNVLFVESGLESEINATFGDEWSFDFEKIVDVYGDFTKEIERIVQNNTQYKVKETKIEIDGSNVKCFEITQTVSPNAGTEIENAFNKMVDDLVNLFPEELREDLKEEIEADMDEALGEMKILIEEMLRGTKTTYYIAKKGGAMLKIVSEIDMSIEDEKYSADVSIDFGKNPEKVFAPNFTVVVEENGTKGTITGKSTVDVSEKTYNLTVNFESDSEYATNPNINFTLNEDGTYKAIVSEGENEVKFGGEFKVDGAKMHLTVDMKDIEDSEVSQIKLDVDFDAEVPKAFEYEDLLKWDEEKINEFLEKINNSDF